MLPVLAREIFGGAEFPREPEPDLIMENEDQVKAYEKAGREDGVMAASYLFHAARISKTIKSAKNVIDLACGPATQLAYVADLNPDVHFLGVDFSYTMLESAEKYIQERNLKNIRFEQGDISNLVNMKEGAYDGVLSTMALHHLPTLNQLECCFKETRRILKPGGKLYLTDFCRLKSLKSVLYFAYMNREKQHHLFLLDYERSLRAAFNKSDFSSLRENFFPDYQFYTTGFVPLIAIIKSRDEDLDEAVRDKLNQIRTNLPREYRKVLDDMRLFFRLGGLKNDPFR